MIRFIQPKFSLFVTLLIFIIPYLSSQEILTVTERAWLEENEPIVLGVDQYNPPMNYLDENDELQGLTIEYMALIGDKLGTEFQYFGATWDVWDVQKTSFMDLMSFPLPTRLIRKM